MSLQCHMLPLLVSVQLNAALPFSSLMQRNLLAASKLPLAPPAAEPMPVPQAENGESNNDSVSLCVSSLILAKLLSADSRESCESLLPFADGSCLAFFCIFLTLALWFWNQTFNET